MVRRMSCSRRCGNRRADIESSPGHSRHRQRVFRGAFSEAARAHSRQDRRADSPITEWSGGASNDDSLQSRVPSCCRRDYARQSACRSNGAGGLPHPGCRQRDESVNIYGGGGGGVRGGVRSDPGRRGRVSGRPIWGSSRVARRRRKKTSKPVLVADVAEIRSVARLLWREGAERMPGDPAVANSLVPTSCDAGRIGRASGSLSGEARYRGVTKILLVCDDEVYTDMIVEIRRLESQCHGS